jgi:probable HAF family extracellular repeat protein
MRLRNLTCCAAGVVAVALMPCRATAQENSPKHHQYKLVDVGTFGGPNSVYNVFTRIGRNDGTIVGAANTADPDLFAPYCFDSTCFVQHAWKWSHGVLTDLGVLRDEYSSYTNAINSRGLIVGQSQNGELDPLTGTPVLYLATVWDHGKIKNLGTFGGGNSIAIAATDQNFVMGAAENGIPDTTGFTGFDGVSQIRAFGWNGGAIFDLGTLGGTGAFPSDMNNRGQIVGNSPTTSISGPFGVAPTAPFLWEKGKMRNLGSLGGNFGGANAINNRGQVIGDSNLEGDLTTHPFLWEHGKMRDLGTLGGSFALAEWLNDVGEVIGYSNTVGDQTIHAFRWRHGSMTDLETVNGDNASNAFGINVRGQIVGQSWFSDGQQVTQSHAFLWDKGGPMVDLNTLVPMDSNLNLFEADFITNRGEIVAVGFTPNGDVHTAILIPRSDPDPFDPGRTASIETFASPNSALPSKLQTALQAKVAQYYRRGTPRRPGALTTH